MFALSIIDREDRAIVRRFTKPAELDAGAQTLNGSPSAPLSPARRSFDQAVAHLDCEVRQTIDCGGHDLFIGEVVDAAFSKAEDTAVLRMEDTRMNYGG